MSALIGALRVSLSADTANFEAGMKRAQRQTQQSASAMQKSLGLVRTAFAGFVAGLSVSMFVNVIKNALEYAGSLAEVAEQLGVTTRDLQTFRFAAGQVGISQEQLEKGLQKLTISMGQAQAGAKAQTDAFNAVGISISDIKGKDAGDVFRMLADKLKDVTDRSQRAAVEVALFGRAGAQLDNLLSGAQGSLDELTAAAEKLGIVLSDEQIQRADDTADKLEALKTVLSANIASAVADNAGAILALGNALASLVRSAAAAVNGWKVLIAELKAGAPFLALGPLGIPFAGAAMDKAGDAARAKLKLNQEFARIRANGLYPGANRSKAAPSGTDIGKFLASGGGGSKQKAAREDHSAEDALRASFQFDQELRRSQQDVLRAQQDLAADYVERTTIGIEILNAEKGAYDAELKYQTALYELTKGKDGLSQAQAAQLKAANDQKDSLERQKLLQEEQEQRLADFNTLDQHDFDRRKDVLQAQDQIATTAAERRKIELELLEIAYQQKKQALEYVIATSKDFAAVEDARRDLENLNKTHAADRQGVIQNTRGPLESYLAGIPDTAAKINEAFEGIGTGAIDDLIGKLSDLEGGFKHLGQTALAEGKQIAQMFLQLALRMLFLRAITGIAGAASSIPSPNVGAAAPVDLSTSTLVPSSADFSFLPGFATGGSFNIMGNSGVDRNVLSLNGLPIARVSHGERLNIGSGGDAGMPPPIHIETHIDATGADPAELSRVRSAVHQLNAELPYRVVQAWYDARSRNVIR